MKFRPSQLSQCQGSFLALHTEATGCDVGADRLTELAIIRSTDGTCEVEFHERFNPERPIDPCIARLQDNSPERLAQSPRFQSLAPRIAEILSGDFVVVWNPAHDWALLEREFVLARIPAPECDVIGLLPGLRSAFPGQPLTRVPCCREVFEAVASGSPDAAVKQAIRYAVIHAPLGGLPSFRSADF